MSLHHDVFLCRHQRRRLAARGCSRRTSGEDRSNNQQQQLRRRTRHNEYDQMIVHVVVASLFCDIRKHVSHIPQGQAVLPPAQRRHAGSDQRSQECLVRGAVPQITRRDAADEATLSGGVGTDTIHVGGVERDDLRGPAGRLQALDQRPRVAPVAVRPLVLGASLEDDERLCRRGALGVAKGFQRGSKPSERRLLACRPHRRRAGECKGEQAIAHTGGN